MTPSRILRACRFVLLLLRSDIALLRSEPVPSALAWRIILAKYAAIGAAAFNRRRTSGSVRIGDRRFHYDSLSSLALLQNTLSENAYLAGMLPPGGLIVDIGANIGQFRWFSEEVLRARRVVSVEPVARSFEVLQRNFPADVHRLAVATVDQVTIYCDEAHSTRASFARHTDADQPEAVPARRLDDLDALRDEVVIDLLKVDTEGAELDVLRSGVACLRRSAYLLVELSVSRPSAGGMAEAISFLRREVPTLELIHLGHQFTEGHVTEAVDCLFVNRALAAQRAPLGAAPHPST